MGTILLCDDDDLVRRAVARSLRQQGHQCHPVSSGAAALELISDKPGAFDVLLSDFNMPGMNGHEVLRRAGEIDSSVVGVLLSGAAGFEDACAAVNGGGAFRLLSKPFDSARLCSVIEDAISYRRLRAEREALGRKLALHNGHLRKVNRELEAAVEERTMSSLDGLVAALALRDNETQWHSHRVSLYARRLAV